MTARTSAVYAALLRARRFATEYATPLASAVDVATALKRLDDVIASFTVALLSTLLLTFYRSSTIVLLLPL